MNCEKFNVVIPARYESERFPGKPLCDIAGKPMIEHVWQSAVASDAGEIFIATDNNMIQEVASSFGANVVMTSNEHKSGSERIAEVCDLLSWPESLSIINLQGDEPLMRPELINQCAQLLNDSKVDISTLASPIQSDEDLHDTNVVKVIVNKSSHALYFSRTPKHGDCLHHHGIYGYKCCILKKLRTLPATLLEKSEKLEQLRALEHGFSIKVGQTGIYPGPSVDTEADLSIVRDLIAK